MNDSQRDLDELRAAIEAVDKDILALLDQRQTLSEAVYRVKKKSLKPIYDPHQEKLKLEAVTLTDNETIKRFGPPLQSVLMRLSRSQQYTMARKESLDWTLGRQIRQGMNRNYPVHFVATQGNAFSYSAKAATILFPERAYFPYRTFEEALFSVVRDEADAVVLPLENSTAGTVSDVYQLLQNTNLYITNAMRLDVRHHLLATPGADIKQIKQVISHPQALAQCSQVIKERGWKVTESLNTAFAAQDVAERKDPTVAAIATEDAADAYGLEILDDSISDNKGNQTRFIVVRSSLQISQDADTISLILRLPHSAGSLVSVMNLFSDRGINLSKIQSRPIPRNPWEYYFYIDCEVSPDNPDILDVLYQLQQEATELRLLGWFKEGRAEVDAAQA